MYIKQTYDEGFEKFILTMKDKYPQVILKQSGISDDSLDLSFFAKRFYLDGVSESTADTNANVQLNDIAVFTDEAIKGIWKLNTMYLLWKTLRKQHTSEQRANEIIEKEINKTIGIHDMVSTHPYCYAFDGIDVAEKGLPFVLNKPSKPPKHADSFLQQSLQLLQFASKRFAGATACPNVLIIYSAFLKKDSLEKDFPVPNYKKDKKMFERFVKQRLQEFIYLLNQPVRGTQSLFSNITIFDNIFLKEMCKNYLVMDDLIDPDFAMYLQRLFLEVYNEENKDKLTTFPVLTAQIKKNDKGEIEDLYFLDMIVDMNINHALINIFSDSSLNSLSSCCRLVNNIEDLINVTKDENTNLIGGSSVKVGSIGVATVNLVRNALKTKDIDEYLDLVKEDAMDCYKINHAKRMIIEKNMKKGKMPLYSEGFVDLNTQYSTLGFIGLYEAVHYLIGKDLRKNKEALDLAIKILDVLESVRVHKMKHYGYRCNIEAVPAEAMSPRMVKADNTLFKMNDFELYGNQFIPLEMECDIVSRVVVQSELEKYLSGGGILHINSEHKIENKEVMKDIIKYVVQAGVKYFAINYFFSECVNPECDGIFQTELDQCLTCGGEVTHSTRIVGFLVPYKNFNKERKKEYHRRKKYKTLAI